MTNLRPMIEWAKQNPNDPRATELRRRLENDPGFATNFTDVKISRLRKNGLSEQRIFDLLKDEEPNQTLLSGMGDFIREGSANEGAASKFGRGLTKSFARTTLGAADLVGAVSDEKADTLREDLKTEGFAEGAGNFVGNVAQFAVPGGMAANAVKGTGLVGGAALAANAASQGAVAGAVSAAQEGELNKTVATNFVISAGLPLVGAGLKEIGKSLKNSLPKKLVEGLIKQTPSERVAELRSGGDTAQFLLDSKLVGSMDDLIKQADDETVRLSKKVATELTKASDDIVISKSTIIDDVVARMDDAGLSASEVDDIVKKSAPQVKKLLEPDTFTPTQANKLRVALDKLFKEADFRGDGSQALNKQVLLSFDNSLRNAVQTKVPSTQELFSEWAKNIVLKEALEARAVASSGSNAINLMDLIAAGGGFFGAGPVGAFGSFVSRRIFESPTFKTSTAAGIQNAAPAIGAAANVAGQAIQKTVPAAVQSLRQSE